VCVDLGGVQEEHAVIADRREDALVMHVPRHIRHWARVPCELCCRCHLIVWVRFGRFGVWGLGFGDGLNQVWGLRIP